MLFLSAIFVSMIVGSIGSRSHDFGIAFMLVVVSTVAAVVGPRWTWPTPLERTQRQRSKLMVLWMAGALLTLVAGIELAVNG
jgi:hypothetical protein